MPRHFQVYFDLLDFVCRVVVPGVFSIQPHNSRRLPLPFVGVVPRTFLGALVVALLSAPVGRPFQSPSSVSIPGPSRDEWPGTGTVHPVKGSPAHSSTCLYALVCSP